jgi:hypothetical protein
MKKYPEHIRKIQKDFNVPDEAVIEVKVGEGQPRVCDYCNTTLIDDNGYAVRTAYLTDFGLICGDCIGDAETQSTYFEGDSVFNEDWYQDGIDRDCF